MLDANAARNLTNNGKGELSLFDKLQLAYLNFKIKLYAKCSSDEVSVSFRITEKVTHVLEEKGYKIRTSSESLFPDDYPTLSTVISWAE